MLVKVKCAHDRKRMFDLDPKTSLESLIEIKCPHCGTLNRVHIKNGKYTADRCSNRHNTRH
ncbi:Com family DNA-binding transcriptional regulator [Alkalicella caledoniensis]|uniref:Com family DNA-binding transcriptional regulator n=2 Tax=Alkalicella caledoniensis TaxID=2731377 RepID=A0A7G9W3U4_ALKCA|nr:Com family DNA-binding transcriptional regulator [Alkalicella caledoniensis]